MLQFFSESCKDELGRALSPTLLYVSKIDATDLENHPRTAHQHNGWFEMVLVRRGGGKIIIGDRAHVVKQGDLLLYNRGVVHDELPEANRELGILCVAFTGFQLPGLEADCMIPADALPVVELGESYAAIHNIWLMIFETLRDNPKYAAVTCHYLTQALISIVRTRIEQAQPLDDIDEFSALALGNQIKKFIDENYAEELNLQSLGASFNMSPYYLAHVFKKATGFAPIQYIAKRRLGEAQEKLIHTTQPITDIAMDIGYNNISSFNYAFAKFIGMSPSQFRKTYSN